MARKRTTEDFIKRAILIHPEYNYSKVNYIDAKTKVEIICPTHGSFFQQPSNHLHGDGCPKCGLLAARQNRSFNTEKFIEKANITHKGKYNYSKVNYKKAIEPVIIICPKHGEFKQLPSIHLQGRGCPTCGYIKMATHNTLIQDKVINSFQGIHGNKYDYSKVKYINDKNKIIIICPEHGEFKQSPGDHKRGQGCPKCKESKGEKLIAKYLVENNIYHLSQHRFSDCKDKKSLPFDFYLPGYNMCIEFDGIQHYDKDKQFMRREDKYHYITEHDSIKSKYCKEHNIKLLRISYNQIDEINEILNKIFEKIH